MSYCSHCGAQQAKTGEACEHCGHRLGLMAPGAGPDTRTPEKKMSDAAIAAKLQGLSFCSHCGVVVPEGEYCSHCGAQL